MSDTFKGDIPDPSVEHFPFDFQILLDDTHNEVHLQIGSEPLTLDSLEGINTRMNEIMDQLGENSVTVIGYSLGTLQTNLTIGDLRTILTRQDSYIGYVNRTEKVLFATGGNPIMAMIANAITQIALRGKADIYNDRQALKVGKK